MVMENKIAQKHGDYAIENSQVEQFTHFQILDELAASQKDMESLYPEVTTTGTREMDNDF